MKKKSIKFSLLLILFFTTSIYSQVFFEATIENQVAVGTDFYFDIYLTRTGANDLYLNNGQFLLTFNSVAFNNPVLSLDPDDATYFNLTNSDGTSCGSFYYPNIATSVSGNQLQISLNIVAYSNQSQFDSRIAKIDNQSSTHRLGRYKVSNLIDPSTSMDLLWVTSDPIRSKVFSDASTSPWVNSEASGTWTQPDIVPLPVELASFTSIIDNNAVTLTWETATEVNNYGFDVERKNQSGNWEKLGFVEGGGTTNSTKVYSFIDDNIINENEVSYRLKQIDIDGTFNYSKILVVDVSVLTGIEDDLPHSTKLSQNYPNPFNPTTTFSFELAEISFVNLSVYDVIGQKVAELVNESLVGGVYNREFNAKNLPSGTYICALTVGQEVFYNKILLLK